MSSVESVHVDWYQFRIDVGDEIPDMGRIAAMRIRLSERVGRQAAMALMSGDHDVTSGHELRFAHCAIFRESGCKVYFGSQSYFLIALSGAACYFLQRKLMLTDVMKASYGVCSRLDIAIDIATDATPAEVAAEGMERRQVSMVNSRSGQTIYLGSRKSDAMCRVYRYAEPHPRAHLVRAEFEFKRKLAPVVAQAVIDYNVRETATGACKRFGLETLASMLPAASNRLVAPSRGTRDDAGTVLWLQTQVAPAVQRLIREGVLTADEATMILINGGELPPERLAN